MTEKIYDKDPHILQFNATVLSCEKTEDGRYAVTLDRTAFFPEEGGQGSDKGTLNGFPVLHVSIDNTDTLTHYLSSPLEAGSMANGKVDWEQRFDYMQQHTGEHILSGLIHKHFGYNNVGFHLGAEITTLDFDGVLTMEELRRMELLANRAIYENLPVHVSFPAKEELDALEYRSKIELFGAVRIVEIPDIDVCACCAPHVDSIGQVGMLKIASMEKHRGGVRITILCGSRALKDYTEKQDMTAALSSLLSAKPDAITDSAKRLKKENLEQKERLNALQEKLFSAKIEALPAPETSPHAILFEESMDTKAVRNAVNRLSSIYQGYSAVFTGSEENGYSFILGSEKSDCNAAAKVLRESLQAKCGGSSLMIQGSVHATEKELRTLLLSF